ncbi:MAG: thioredoxin domain-containing protein [Pseudolabrys sp.]
MPRFSHLVACFVVIVLSHFAAHADDAWYPIKADDGTTIANHRVPVELESRIERMPGVVVLGNPRGEVTLNEFYDLNCPFCRAAEPEIEKLLKTVKELRLVLVPFPVLGIPSIKAGKVELAVLQQSTPKQFYEFHRRTMKSRGVMDGKRAFAIAQAMGLDDKKVAKIANGNQVTEIMISHVRLGNALGIQATPGFVIKGVAINGYPGPKALARIVDSVERCDRVVCAGNSKSKSN